MGSFAVRAAPAGAANRLAETQRKSPLLLFAFAAPLPAGKPTVALMPAPGRLWMTSVPVHEGTAQGQPGARAGSSSHRRKNPSRVTVDCSVLAKEVCAQPTFLL